MTDIILHLLLAAIKVAYLSLVICPSVCERDQNVRPPEMNKNGGARDGAGLHICGDATRK